MEGGDENQAKDKSSQLKECFKPHWLGTIK